MFRPRVTAARPRGRRFGLRLTRFYDTLATPPKKPPRLGGNQGGGKVRDPFSLSMLQLFVWAMMKTFTNLILGNT